MAILSIAFIEIGFMVVVITLECSKGYRWGQGNQARLERVK